MHDEGIADAPSQAKLSFHAFSTTRTVRALAAPSSLSTSTLLSPRPGLTCTHPMTVTLQARIGSTYVRQYPPLRASGEGKSDEKDTGTRRRSLLDEEIGTRSVRRGVRGQVLGRGVREMYQRGQCETGQGGIQKTHEPCPTDPSACRRTCMPRSKVLFSPNPTSKTKHNDAHPGEMVLTLAKLRQSRASDLQK